MTAALAEVLPQEPETQAAAPAPFKLDEQIIFIATLALRMESRDGSVSRETWLTFDADDHRKCNAVAATLIWLEMNQAAIAQAIKDHKGRGFRK
jgi:hypothetical protein